MATQYYVASSLDGFIADTDDGIGWLDALGMPDEDTYTPFIAQVGAIAMGASTYAFILNHLSKDSAEAWPYKQPCWVFTHRDWPVPDGADVTFVRDDIAAVHRDMAAAAAGQNLWVVGGGDLAGQFLDAGLLDEIIVTVASTTLASGKPLLPRQLESGRLRLQSARRLGDAFGELRYQVLPKP